ncbi:penicillin-binding protein 2 [Paraburkholderia caballeronis]|uniref:Peptidoglycan D,D-transpeptidase MrdA n=1 Tax=Paraburkholderia caballeronis TaxID=416943 RepID=A0A1H7HCW1_9BURK|nr:penicillin-binding protein 2 [Paraburkholderia caballeronis]PXW29557.1 penicillin-binding protein 2 [Paraburkholderia caballeronis]PXX04816.1 penicillin-binding protein 2 [Paraburkholderia caballeronis]RAK05877.1 penicillin-binding protein 2 [Paraburkholderia caballeronis]SEB42735.1 penicillin-binding protein 2 [Paraburkholderia caballeronis]SEK48129.1 penicillin-binding protein 2 [Paraburkholderia caballeronis]
MTEFKDTQQQLTKFRLRVAAAGLFVFVCFGLIAFRFVYLQVWNHSKYSLQADENRISVAPIVPNRGIITDRNGVVLAKNYSAYTLEITPSKLNDTLDNVIDQLSTVIPIDARDRRRFKKLQEDSKNFESLPIRTRLTDDEVARFTAQRFRFPGVEVRARLFRQYPLGPTAAHVIGYIGRISQRDQDRLDDQSDRNASDPDHYDPRLDANNYNGTDYIGKIGVEQSYETELHGLTGFEEVEVTAGGRPVRTLSRTQATPGNNLVLSIDIGLQQVAEEAFAGRRGALVAIEPSTGDILAFVSAPSFDPNSFVDGIDQQTWDELNNSPDHPLLNRPLHGTYPPGSTYKPFMALAALTLHKRTPNWGFQDPGSYTFGGHTFHNDVRSGQGWIDMNRAIMVSNDTYFFMLAHDLGVDNIANFMRPFGFGQLTGIDIAGEARGILPSTDWKRKAYRKPEQQRWYEGETISLGIGQGYNSFTILQLAHATATLANDGVLMKPHLVKEIENPITHDEHLTVPRESGRVDVKQADIDVVKRGMENVTMNQSGTAFKVFQNAPYTSAGKTGTAQVFSLQGAKYQAHALAEHLRDHALFIAFAPVEHPQIALALIVENGGWGAQAAGPIARRVLDYYLIDRLKPGAEQAAVAAAASATQDASAPVIGVPQQQGNTGDTGGTQPVRVAAGFTPLPVPAAPADAASAASAPAGASSPAAASAAAAGPINSASVADAASALPSTSAAHVHGAPLSGKPDVRRALTPRPKPAVPVAPDAGDNLDAVDGGTRPAGDGAQSADTAASAPRRNGPRRPRAPAGDPGTAAIAPPPKPAAPAAGGIDE